MTPNPTTKGMSEVQSAIAELANRSSIGMSEQYANGYFDALADLRRSLASAPTDTSQVKAATAISEAEVLAVWDSMFDWLPDEHREARVARSTIESKFAELAEVKADRDSWRDQCSDRVADWGREYDARIAAESDRTALLEVVRRLLPYAQGHADPDHPGSVALAAEARALLSRITAPEASR